MDLFPTVKEKAAALAFNIIRRHVFIDGNKRTGVHVAWEFLQINGHPVQLESDIADIAEGVAKGSLEFADLLSWLHAHQLGNGID